MMWIPLSPILCGAEVRWLKTVHPVQDHCRRGDRESKRVRKPEAADNYKETVFCTPQGSCTYELTEVVTTCLRSG